MEVELPELLFFDTFSHDTYEQNLDLVQFPKPVYITEVRIIPLGARVHADFPGGVRLGATNPSNFHIQLYVNDLGKPGAPIFESLGELEYNQNNCIHLQCGGGPGTGPNDEFVRRIPTDGLVLKGWYTTMTLAVYGILTTSIAEPIVSPRETTPQPNEQLLVVPDHHHHQHVLHHPHHLHHHGGAGGGIAEPTCGGGDWIPEPPLPVLVTTHPSETMFVQKEYPEDDSEDAPKDPRPYARRAAAAAAAVITHPLPASAASPPEPIYEPLEAGKILPGDCEPPLPEKRSKAMRSGSFERLRREPSFERMEKEDRRPRPRSPIDSPRRPRSPDRNESSPDEEEVVDDVEDVDDDLDDDIEMDGSFHRTNGKYGGKRSMHMMEPAIETIRQQQQPQTGKQHPSGSRSSSQHQHQHHHQPHAHHHYQHGHGHTHHSTHQLPSHHHHHHHQQQQPERVISPPPQVHSLPSVCDTATVVLTPVASPTTMLNVPTNLPDEDAISVTEQFEPILSDEEIPEDFDFEADGGAAVTGGIASGGYEPVDEALNKQFDPFSATLERYVHPGTNGEETDLVRLLGHGEQKLMRQFEQLLGQGRYGREATARFEQESAEWKERFVDYAEQLVHVLGQLLAKDDVRDAFQQQLERWIRAEWVGVTDRLVNCICVGLDFERAMVQPQPAFKLRHMKSGIRLAEFLGPHESFIGLLLHTQDHFILFDRLLGLYSQPHMALSIKLMIIRTIYACLDTRNAVHYFLSPSYNGYQILLDLLQENPSTRISFALKSLLRKISLYENLELIHSTVEQLYVRAGDGQQEHQLVSDQDLLELLRSALTELTSAISLQEVSLAQPKRFLPVSAKFEIHKDIASSLNVSRTVVQFFKIHRLVESLVLLLDLSITPPALCELIYNLLACMLKSIPKLRYLVDSLPFTNLLLRWLFQRLPAATNGGCDEATVADEVTIAELSRPQLLGVELVYKVQTIYHLDAIASTGVVVRGGGDSSQSVSQSSDEIELERDRLVEHLHDLYELACGAGRRFVVEVLSMDDNLAVLLELIEKEQRAASKEDGTGSVLTAAATKHKSPIVGYCVDLVDCTVRHGEAVGYLAQHGPALLALVKQHDQFEPGVSAILQELAVYLKPLELHDLFAYIDITPLVELMRRSLEYVTAFPGDLITALRLVRLLGIPPYDDYEQPGGHAEFKYKYTLLQFYSADGQALLLAILDKLTHHFDQPAIHTSSLASQQGVLLTQLLCPLVYILRKLVTYLIECRNTEFRDLTLIEPLLRTYTLMQCVPIHSAAGCDARQVQREVVRILLAYTQPTPPEGLDTNNVHRSLWTQMVGELVRFTLAGPNYFLPGLLVLTTYVILMSNIMRKRDGWCAVLHKFLRKAKESPDTYRTLFALLCDFWRSLVSFENDGCANLPKRTVKLSLEQLGQLMPLYESGDEDVFQQMLTFVEELMALFKGDSHTKESPSELNGSPAAMDTTALPESTTTTTDSLGDNLTFLQTQLKMEISSVKSDQGKAASSTPIDWSTVSVDPLPQAEGIVTQYGSRSVYLLSEDCEDQLKATDWFGFTPCDDDLEREQIPCDLQDLAKVCLSGDTNLTADCKRLLHLSASPHSNRDRLTTAPCFRTRRVEVEPSTGRPEKKIFGTTPLRGRGFSRTPTTRGDLFRSRPPNTSRPPSLHVDDFLALETCGAQPTGPTGYNKLSRDIITIRGTNRSRGRNFPDRGARSGGGGGGGGGPGGGNSNGGGGSGGNGGHWQGAPGGNSGGNGGGGVGGSIGGGSNCWTSAGSSQMHDGGGGGNGPGGGKHFGHGLSSGGGGVGPVGSGSGGSGVGGSSSGHYRDPPSHFGGSQRSRSGRGFNRYSVRLYARQI
uniref:Virilizer N-terminal domain-containing protein n=1 Tax=Anopheles culicifacies TaxID=139723 RepID=A0A182M0X8_9DIPT